MASTEKVILFLGRSCPGRLHDLPLLKQALPPEHPWFEDVEVLVDSGYQGMQKDYCASALKLPHKRPRKRKNQPRQPLSPEHQAYNRALAHLPACRGRTCHRRLQTLRGARPTFSQPA